MILYLYSNYECRKTHSLPRTWPEIAQLWYSCRLAFYRAACTLLQTLYIAPSKYLTFLDNSLISFRFVQLLVNLGTPYFSMLQYFDRVLKDLPVSLFACTENEATRIGRFLNETLGLLSRYTNSPCNRNEHYLFASDGKMKLFSTRSATISQVFAPQSAT